MSVSKDEILLEKDCAKVFAWIKANANVADNTVSKHLNQLLQEEHEEWCRKAGVDPRGHYDPAPRTGK
ncbi:MAG: hypothetical protein RR900_05880 [Ruthenibacterium sp.]